MDFDKQSRRKLQEIDKHFARRRRASSPLSTPLPTGLGNSNPAYNFTTSAWLRISLTDHEQSMRLGNQHRARKYFCPADRHKRADSRCRAARS
jgi:hypothetical protein